MVQKLNKYHIDIIDIKLTFWVKKNCFKNDIAYLHRHRSRRWQLVDVSSFRNRHRHLRQIQTENAEMKRTKKLDRFCTSKSTKKLSWLLSRLVVVKTV